MCLLENIPAYKDVPAHQHIDMIYLANPSGGAELPELIADGTLRWFCQEEVEALKGDDEIFVETQTTLKHLFTSDCFARS
jgi:hypothetical protein